MNIEDKINKHIVTIIIITIACTGLIVESITQHWEFWVSPLLGVGSIVMWIMHITQYSNARFRENYYLIYVMMGAFFHGVHETSFFDVAVIIVLMLVTFSVYDNVKYPVLIFTEYIFIMLIQFWLAMKTGSVIFDDLNISRIILHIVVVICVFFECRKMSRTEWRLQNGSSFMRRKCRQ